MIENTIKEIHTKNEVEILELNNSIIYIKSLMDGQGIGNSWRENQWSEKRPLANMQIESKAENGMKDTENSKTQKWTMRKISKTF